VLARRVGSLGKGSAGSAWLKGWQRSVGSRFILALCSRLLFIFCLHRRPFGRECPPGALASLRSSGAGKPVGAALGVWVFRRVGEFT